MTYAEFADFIANRMVMQNVYQPVALKLMLTADDGTATTADMNRAFQLQLDTDEDFHDIRRYPCEVLIKREAIERIGDDTYRLLGFDDLSDSERATLIELADSRLANFTVTGRASERGSTRQAGRVYILTNPAMPAYMKVGFTTRTAEARAHDLDRVGGTWLPFPFKVAYQSDWLSNAFDLEQAIFREFVDARVPGREFMDVTAMPGVMALIQRDGINAA